MSTCTGSTQPFIILLHPTLYSTIIISFNVTINTCYHPVNMCTRRVINSTVLTERFKLFPFRVTFVFIFSLTVIQVTLKSLIVPTSASSVSSSPTSPSAPVDVFTGDIVVRAKRNSLDNSSSDAAEMSDINYSLDSPSHVHSTIQTLSPSEMNGNYLHCPFSLNNNARINSSLEQMFFLSPIRGCDESYFLSPLPLSLHQMNHL